MLQIHDSDKIKLYTQGSYGCIYKPGLTCKGKLDSKKFIRKIQKNNKGAQHEKIIGDAIKKIKHYKDYFAPVIETCPISINTIENQEIKKCEIMNKTSEEYVSNKIRYVGKNTLADYLLDIYKTSPKLFLKQLFTTNLDILDEVSILLKHNILHMDLKENNIIIDEVLNKPIIIDFGLSFQTIDINDSNMPELFFVYQHYTPWCFEINFINCIVNTIATETNGVNIKTTPIQQSDLEAISNKFIQDNTFLQSNFSKEELDGFSAGLKGFITSLQGKMLKDIIDILIKYSNTWDNYAVAVIYLSIIKENKLESMNASLLKTYVDLLKSIILSSPDKRVTSDSTRTSIYGLTQRVFKQEKMVIQEKLVQNSMDDIFIQQQGKRSAQHKLNNLTQQADVYKAKV
jgi:serine/threonine protein kinase